LRVNSAEHSQPRGFSSRKPPHPVIDVTPVTNVHTIVALALRLTALNFLVLVLVKIATPLLISIASQGQSAEQAPIRIAWGMVGALSLGGILLWFLALPAARLVARGVPGDISFGNLTLEDFYSLGFTALGVVYIVRHSAGALNWMTYFLRWLVHHEYTPWNEPGRGYQIMSVFIPFIVGILLVVMRKKLGRIMAGSSPHVAVSFGK
jgi:hypothetical protein